MPRKSVGATEPGLNDEPASFSVPLRTTPPKHAKNAHSEHAEKPRISDAKGDVGIDVSISLTFLAGFLCNLEYQIL